MVANLYVQPSPFGTDNATTAHTFPTQIGPSENIGGIVASHDACLTLVIERIEVLLG